MDENDLASDFSAIPNLLELIKNDEGLQQIFQEMGDFAKGAVLGNTTDLVGFPVQALGDALNAMGLPVGDKPVGGTNWLREQLKQEQPADESLSQTLGGLVGMPDPQSLASALGLVGAIRRGGDPNLFAWHSTRAPIGIPGQMDHPKITAATEAVAAAARNTGKHWGRPMFTPEDAKRYLEMGARLCFHGADLLLVKRGLEAMQRDFAPLGFTFENRFTS